MERLSERPIFNDLPLRDITKEFSEPGLRQRLSYEISQTDWSDDIRQQIRVAEELALEAHRDDSRGDHPYSTHFLRVATRIISDDHLGVKDPELLIAALLHDTVEDHPEFYAEITPPNAHLSPREHSLLVINDQFSPRTAHLVGAVTNPEELKKLSGDEKRAAYQDHVREVLATDEAAGIIKLSDFIDNCAGLGHNEDPERAAHLALKYLPLIPDFKAFVEASSLLLADKKPELLLKFNRAEIRCRDLIEAA